jgi:diguanylate cyclase (GGDEF)-like protein/PAS domain S-box-containing protein
MYNDNVARKNIIILLAVSAALIAAIYICRLYSYTLFHTFAELFSFVIGIAIFLFIWNAKRFITNSYYILIGIAYAYIAIIDMLHALSYSGMNIFTGFDSNLPTQLWILARYVESFSILIALLLIKRHIRTGFAFLAYTAVTTAGIASIFYWRVFPDCFIEGSGLTPFKIISEYIIITVILISIYLIYRRKDFFSRNVYVLLQAAMAVTILSELSFTLYADVYGIFNMVGHLLKVLSFYLVYKAIIESGLMQPYETLFSGLKKSRKRFRDLVELLPTIVIETDREGYIKFVNRTGMEISGFDMTDVEKGINIQDVIVPEQRQRLMENIGLLKKGKDIGTQKYTALKKDGIRFAIMVEGNIIFDKKRGFVGFRVVASDISELEKKDNSILKSESKYREMFENSLDGRYRSTLDGKYIEVNQALVEMLGYSSSEELMKIDIPTQLYSDSLDRPDINRRKGYFEVLFNRKDGTKMWAEVSAKVIYENGSPAYYLGSVRDITLRKEVEDEIRFLSFHDKLTGLYNRAYFDEELKRLDTARQLPLTVIIGDVNGLKVINDSLGHRTGDELLKKIAGILKESFRDEDIIARWGGDEFAAILPHTGKDESHRIIDRVRKRCGKESIPGMPLSISFGVSTRTNIYRDIDNVLKAAEDKMYRHKLIDRKSFHSAIVESLMKALKERDYETEEHIRRMRDYSVRLGKILGLSENNVIEISLLASLHDIGKLSIPDSIMLKKGKLDPQEWEIMKSHVETGYRIAGSSLELGSIAQAILAHHEWYDGTGYPQGLKGEEIPFSSRIISVVDSYDAMTSNRPYRKAMDRKEAINELKKFSGKQFDPKVVDAFLKMLEMENKQKKM